jgi:hypothetical protein
MFCIFRNNTDFLSYNNGYFFILDGLLYWICSEHQKCRYSINSVNEKLFSFKSLSYIRENSNNHTVGISQVQQMFLIYRSLSVFFHGSSNPPYFPTIETRVLYDFI